MKCVYVIKHQYRYKWSPDPTSRAAMRFSKWCTNETVYITLSEAKAEMKALAEESDTARNVTLTRYVPEFK